ncbi:MAG TPA: Stk1 family PASTA domain-containing Ser/Thr kinase [Beutenbergiaceae bacterium]|nr:Stk1 family PASTA domain-containing Ser/Thr kinase [Beutenbergiaceae bacterium]
MVDDVPRVLAGRYEVGELIGRGGMAEVHIGRDNRLGRTVAIKVLRSDLARDPSFQTRFRREAQSAASLNHPAIVSVYDTSEDTVRAADGTETQVPFIVMEYVEGHTVRDLLKDGSALPIDEAIEIATGVLAALEYSHHSGIVHRDIKPANVMLTPTGAVKVMDFGIARAMADSAGTMTQTQAVVGTAQYLSPEQARGEVVDARSDLYSTGCLLYELLTGRPPFEGDSAVAVAYQHVSEAPQPPSMIASDVPEPLDRIVMKALTKDREERYTTAAEFRSDLEAAALHEAVMAPALGAAAAADNTGATHVLGAGAPAPGPEPQAEGEAEEDQPRSRKALIWILVILGLLVTAAIAYLLWDRANYEEPPPPPPPAVVPDLSGLDQDEVIAALGEEDLEPAFQDPVTDDEIEEGIAVSWDPETGTEMPEGETIVEVTLSAGPEALEIPAVAGMSQDRARDELRNAGFEDVRTDTIDEPRTPADEAVATEPGAGESVPPDTQITLFLATGNVELEDMTGAPIEQLEEHLSDLGLSSRITFQDDDGDPGLVLSQNRSGQVPINTQVEVVVSQEPPEEDPTDEPTDDDPTDEPTDEDPPDDDDSGENGNGDNGGGNNGNNGNGNGNGN